MVPSAFLGSHRFPRQQLTVTDRDLRISAAEKIKESAWLPATDSDLPFAATAAGQRVQVSAINRSGREALGKVLQVLGISPEVAPNQESWRLLLGFLENHFEKFSEAIPPQGTSREERASPADKARRQALYDERFRVAFDSVQDLIWLTNAQGGISACNQRFCQFMGLGRSAIVGRDWIKIASPQASEWLGVPIDGMVPGAFGMHSCWAHFADDSSYAFLDTRILPIFSEAGDFVGHVGIARDQTSSRAAASQPSAPQNLGEADVEAHGVITKGLTAELNGILAGILGNLSFSKVSSIVVPALHKSLEQVEKAAMRAQSLVRQVEMFSHQETPDLRPFAVESLIGRLLRTLRSGMPDGVVIDLDMKRVVPLLLADPKHVQQVISYIAHYAAQELHGRYGFVRISVFQANSNSQASADVVGELNAERSAMVCVRVSAEPTALDVQAAAPSLETTARPALYSPLGLGFVRDLVTVNQGDLIISRGAKGTSEFQLFFPSIPSHHPVAEMAQGKPLRRSTLARPPRSWPSVLYVDSDQLIVLFMERLGEQRSFHLRGFTRAQDGLRALMLEPATFDLAIVDSQLRPNGGFEFVSAARNFNPTFPIFIVSTYIDEDLIARSHGAGATEVVFKNDIEGLVALIAKHDK